MQNPMLGLAHNRGKWLLCILYIEQVPAGDGSSAGNTVRRRFLELWNRDRRPQSGGRGTAAGGTAAEAGRREKEDAETETEKTEGYGWDWRRACGSVVPRPGRRGAGACGSATSSPQPLTAAPQHARIGLSAANIKLT
jgi:hypothetical protein